jgi:FkbM family methyltransferase
VEPHPASASLLDRNLRANSVTCGILRQSALFSRSGPVTLNAGGPGKSAYSSVSPIDGASDAFTVYATTLDAMLKGQAQLVKLDVEGAELEVLAGAAESIERGLLPLLIVECTEANLARFGATTESLFTALRNNGYTVCRFDAPTHQLVVRDYAGPIGYDNLFAARHLEEVNRRLSTAAESSRRIAYDILTRGAAAEKLFLQGSRREQFEQRAADVAFRSLGEANWRADQAENHAQAAERRASDARSAVQESERRTEEARKTGRRSGSFDRSGIPQPGRSELARRRSRETSGGRRPQSRRGSPGG